MVDFRDAVLAIGRSGSIRRASPEETRHDLIFDLVGDKSSIEKIGHVVTEPGTSTMNGYL